MPRYGVYLALEGGMLQSKARFVFLLLVGIALAIAGHLALKGLVAYFVLPGHPHWVRVLLSLSQPPLGALVQLAPAFLVGWWGRRSGFVLGAFVGFVSAIAIASFTVSWRHDSYIASSLFYLLFVWALPSALLASAAGAAGQLASVGRPLTIHSSGRRSGAA